MGCHVWGRTESDTTKWLHFHFSVSCIGEGNGNPLQCSCLENPRDGGAWWAAIYGVTQSRTWLKRLSSSSSSRTREVYTLQQRNLMLQGRFIMVKIFKKLIIKKTPHFQCKGWGFDPWLEGVAGTKIPCAVWSSQEKEKSNMIIHASFFPPQNFPLSNHSHILKFQVF